MASRSGPPPHSGTHVGSVRVCVCVCVCVCGVGVESLVTRHINCCCTEQDYSKCSTVSLAGKFRA